LTDLDGNEAVLWQYAWRIGASMGELVREREAAVTDENFWSKLSSLVEASSVVVDRPKGSVHPRIPTLVYPLDYGFLSGTSSVDGHGVDVWIGSLKRRAVTGVVCTVDLSKRDAEVKILLGCSRAEQRLILSIHNYRGGSQAGVLIRRGTVAKERGRKRGSRARSRGEVRSRLASNDRS
jgi:inorganic pyrophosphatase